MHCVLLNFVLEICGGITGGSELGTRMGSM